MSIIKTGKNLGLSTMSVDIEDISYLSNYFNVTEFNSTFGVGKNCIVVNGTDSLSTADILVEARDSNGNYLFIEKAIYKDTLTNKTKYIYSFYVYEDNSNGAGNLILVSTTKDNKKVRWKSNIVINNTTETTSVPRFYDSPKLFIESDILPATYTTNKVSSNSVSGSAYTIAYYPSKDFNILTSPYRKNALDYRLIDNTANFSSSFKNFDVTLYVNKIKDFNSKNEISISDTASIKIKDVKNSTTLLLETPYVYNSKNGIAEISDAKYILNLNYDFTYNSASFGETNRIKEYSDIYGNTRYKKYSYVNIIYKNLSTFSGKIAKHRIYRKSLNLSGDYELILDETITQNEILRDPFTPNKNFENLGSFYNQFHIDNFWFTSSANLSITSDNTTFVDGLKINGNNLTGTEYIITKVNSVFQNRNATYLPYDGSVTGSAFDCNFIKLYKDTNYTLTFNAFIQDTLKTPTSKLNFYLKSSISTLQNDLNYDSSKGLKIASLDFNSNDYVKNSGKLQSFDFKLSNDLAGCTLVIYPEGISETTISNISLKISEQLGYTSDGYFTRILFPISTAGEIFEIKGELYDNNGILTYSNLNVIKTIDPDGITLAPDMTLTTGNEVHIPVGLVVSGSTIISGSLNVYQSITASVVSGSFTGSLYGTSSWSNNSISASYALSSSYAATSSQAITASYLFGASTGTGPTVKKTNPTIDNPIFHDPIIMGSLTTTGDIILKQSVLFSFSSSNHASSITPIIQSPTGSYNAAFFDYVLVSSSNSRVGTVFCCFTGSNITYTEYSTVDIGDTSPVSMSADLYIDTDNTYIRLLSDIPSTQTWNIKAFGRYL